MTYLTDDYRTVAQSTPVSDEQQLVVKDPIQPGTLVTDDQSARVEAALRLRHLSQKDFAAMERCSYQVLNQIIRGKRIATRPYADRLNKLVRLHLIKPVQKMRLAA